MICGRDTLSVGGDSAGLVPGELSSRGDPSAVKLRRSTTLNPAGSFRSSAMRCLVRADIRPWTFAGIGPNV